MTPIWLYFRFHAPSSVRREIAQLKLHGQRLRREVVHLTLRLGLGVGLKSAASLGWPLATKAVTSFGYEAGRRAQSVVGRKSLRWDGAGVADRGRTPVYRRRQCGLHALATGQGMAQPGGEDIAGAGAIHRRAGRGGHL